MYLNRHVFVMPSKDPDLPAHSYTLIRIFTGRTYDSHYDSQVCRVSSCGKRRLNSDCAIAQSDLSLR